MCADWVADGDGSREEAKGKNRGIRSHRSTARTRAVVPLVVSVSLTSDGRIFFMKENEGKGEEQFAINLATAFD
uniref:Uncharacterized protein n=1 Tax=Oryza barthii TaxID=65489 RepID=A0A0D3FDN7_9ORYZ